MFGGRGRNMDPLFESGDPFAGFGGLGGHQSLVSSFFGGQDPFDNPFFTRPFGGMLESNFFGPMGSHLMNAHQFGIPNGNPLMDAYQSGFSTGSILMNTLPSGFATGSHPSGFATRSHPSGFATGSHPSGFATGSHLSGFASGSHPSGFIQRQSSLTNRSRGPIIEELNSDEEEEVENQEEKKGNPKKHCRSSKGPSVEEPDDEAEERKSKQMQLMKEVSSVNNSRSHAQTHSFTFQSSSVSYGGSNGAYRTSSRTMRTGSDGLTIEESKEADSTTGRAAHRISKGIHEKGHTVARNLNSDGRVDTMQILHNLNEDELAGFEEAWKGSARKHLPGWSEGLNLQNGSGSSAQIGRQSRGGWALPSTEPSSHFSRSKKPDVADWAGSSHSLHSGRMRANIGESTGSSRGRSRAAPAGNMDQVWRP